MGRLLGIATFAAVSVLAYTPGAGQDIQELLNEEERQWIEALREPIIVGTETGYHPYNFVDEQGELSGVVGDYMRLLEERLGIDFAVHAYPTFAEVLEAAQRRHVDIVPLIIAAPERKAYLDFTQPAFETRDYIFTRQEVTGTLGIDDLRGMKVAVVEGYALQAIIENEHPEIDLQLFPTEVDGLLALSLGSVDAFVSEIGTSSYIIQREAITNLRVAGEIAGTDSQTIGTRNDWPILNRIIGKGLASITPQEHAEIQRRWINISGVDPGVLKRLWAQFGVALVVLFSVLVGVLIWSISLKRLVARRTQQLELEFAERRLVEAAKERLAVAVEQSAEYVLVIGTDGKVEYANLSFEAAHGGRELKGVAFASLGINSATGTLDEALQQVREDGTWRGRVELASGTEGAIKVAMTIAPIFSDTTELDGYVVTARDITHEEKLEARLRQGEKLSSLGTLAGGIAHDFNNLLVPILGYADLLRKGGDDKIAPYVDGIVDASERARELVKQILIFGRGGASAMEPLDLRFEIDDSSGLIESLLPAKVELNTDLLECRSVMGDRSQMQQILVNLCSNACDAMAGRGGVIDIRLEPKSAPSRDSVMPPELAPGEYALLTVTDDGEGMDEETLARIFDPYYTDKPQGKGTGLGLAIVHGVVTAHGGAIQVDSSPGTGTSVRIYLPTVAARPVRPYAEPRTEIRRGRGERILILDDDELVLRTVDIMVQSLGYEGCKWSNPLEALEAFREAPDDYDAILADFKMPDMTGLEFADKVREIRPDIPIIIMTGNTGALRDSGVDYIAKPLSLAQLADCLLGFIA